MTTLITFTKSLAAASANNIATSQSPGSAAFTLNGSTVSGGVATIDTASNNNMAIGRRVLITSGGDDSGINFLVTGTVASGAVVTDTFAGANAGTAYSNLDFVTVTKIIGSGAVASTVTAGTNGIGSSSWLTANYYGRSPLNIGYAVELVSGAVNYTVQYTYDDPNNLSSGVSFPLAFDTILASQSATADSTLTTPIAATRVLINSGTGVIRVRVLQAGIG